MPQDTNKIVASSWTQLTDADVSAITFQNISGYAVFVRVTAGATAPAENELGILYQPNQGERNVSLSALAPGVSGGNRVWAKFQSIASASVWVSHA